MALIVTVIANVWYASCWRKFHLAISRNPFVRNLKTTPGHLTIKSDPPMLFVISFYLNFYRCSLVKKPALNCLRRIKNHIESPLDRRPPGVFVRKAISKSMIVCSLISLSNVRKAVRIIDIVVLMKFRRWLIFGTQPCCTAYKCWLSTWRFMIVSGISSLKSLISRKSFICFAYD